MNKTQGRVLQAIRLLDEVAIDEYKSNPDESIRAARHFLHSYTSIRSAVEIVSNGRRSSARQISDALAALVANGTLEKSIIANAMTLYVRKGQ